MSAEHNGLGLMSLVPFILSDGFHFPTGTKTGPGAPILTYIQDHPRMRKRETESLPVFSFIEVKKTSLDPTQPPCCLISLLRSIQIREIININSLRLIAGVE